MLRFVEAALLGLAQDFMSFMTTMSVLNGVWSHPSCRAHLNVRNVGDLSVEELSVVLLSWTIHYQVFRPTGTQNLCRYGRLLVCQEMKLNLS